MNALTPSPDTVQLLLRLSLLWLPKNKNGKTLKNWEDLGTSLFDEDDVQHCKMLTTTLPE